MLQRTLGALPRSIKLMFHVKHTPIEKLTPCGRSPFQQPKCIRVDELNRECLDQLGQARYTFASHAHLQLAGITLSAHTNRQWRITAKSGKQCHFLSMVSDGMFQLAGTEGAPHTQYEKPFKQTGFATAIVSNDQVDA